MRILKSRLILKSSFLAEGGGVLFFNIKSIGMGIVFPQKKTKTSVVCFAFTFQNYKKRYYFVCSYKN